MAAGFIRFSHVLTMFVLFATVSGCASLSKGMSEEPVDQNHGKRTFGAFIEDGNIERKDAVNLARASAELDESRIVVVSYNGNVLLAGQVANDDLKAQAGNIAEQVRHVRHVHNELQVVGSNSFLAADAVVEQVQKVYGVQKIVKIIEYID